MADGVTSVVFLAGQPRGCYQLKEEEDRCKCWGGTIISGQTIGMSAEVTPKLVKESLQSALDSDLGIVICL